MAFDKNQRVMPGDVDGLRVVSHRWGGEEFYRAGKFGLYFSPQQQRGERISGINLQADLAPRRVLGGDVLDFLLEHQEVIPKEWEQYARGIQGGVYFWGTKYGDSIGEKCIRYLSLDEGGWDCAYDWLDGIWYSHNPAVVYEDETDLEGTQRGAGTLQGIVVLGPLSPIERVGAPSPRPSAQTYATHQVFVYDAARERLIATLIPDAEGDFGDMFAAGDYSIDVQLQGIETVRDMPLQAKIIAGETTALTIRVDTGIR